MTLTPAGAPISPHSDTDSRGAMRDEDSAVALEIGTVRSGFCAEIVTGLLQGRKMEVNELCCLCAGVAITGRRRLPLPERPGYHESQGGNRTFASRPRTSKTGSPAMPLEPPQRIARASGQRAVMLATCIVLVFALLFVSTLAKTSRYDLRAAPSRHFSTSVKVARVLFHSWAGLEAPAAMATVDGVATPPRLERAPFPAQPSLTVASALVLSFPSLRAPPVRF